MSTELHIASLKNCPTVCITHDSPNTLRALLEILAANNMGVSNRHALTIDQKEKFMNRFDFSVVKLED